MLKDLSFLNFVWTTFCPNPDSSVVSYFQTEWFIPVSEFANTQNTLVWVTEVPKAIQEHELNKKINSLVCCVVNSVGGPYCFRNGAVTKADFYDELNVNVQSEAQQILQSAVPSSIELYSTLHAHCVLF